MCDTFIALPSATADGSIIFGKNSDRPHTEVQEIKQYPGMNYEPGSTLSCTYIEIPQVEKTFAILLSQPDWMWGGEMGANEFGVVIGNEAVWTVEEPGSPALLGMDLIRLGLERGNTAYNALKTIVNLLQDFGQGGACAENDPSFTYHNSFIIGDWQEAWVLETAGKFWVAEKISSPSRNISNGLSIRNKFDLAKDGMVDYALEKELFSGNEPFDFALSFSSTPPSENRDTREAWGKRLLEQHQGKITPEIMMEILRNHESGICMHGGLRTTASMVSQLKSPHSLHHWMTGTPYPCENEFKLITFPATTSS
ncbi:C69 family dipeptidase [Candidatus Riflebacteria bacterium]